ncbi:MAG: glycosyltransferase family 4 protein, partial [Acetobacteraceae bacterium]|nr:glycosyltransferase family 4 protein [Acetobacteraceae bacterium]
HSASALVAQCAGTPPPATPPGPPRRLAMFYPWTDLAERRGGASLRCTLLLDVLAPRVASVEVLQTGTGAPVRQGAVHIASAPLRAYHALPRWAFRCLAFPLLGRAGWGQELFLWWHLERRFDPFFHRRVRDMVRRTDAVLLEYSFWAPVVLAACRRYRVPCVITQHDVLAQGVTRSALLRRMTFAQEVAALRAADHAVCVSPADAEVFAAAGVAARVIANPIDLARMAAPMDTDPREALRERHGISLPPGPLALFVGSRHPPNLAAVARLRALAPRRAEVGFVIAGACAESGREGDVLATGPVAEEALRLLYAASAIVLVPLESGTGSSLKTLEAMAAGRPVLGTSTAFRGLPVHPGADCVIEDEFARWPAVIAALLGDPARAEAIGAAGRRVAEGFDHRRVFAAYGEVLGLAAA